MLCDRCFFFLNVMFIFICPGIMLEYLLFTEKFEIYISTVLKNFTNKINYKRTMVSPHCYHITVGSISFIIIISEGYLLVLV